MLRVLLLALLLGSSACVDTARERDDPPHSQLGTPVITGVDLIPWGTPLDSVLRVRKAWPTLVDEGRAMAVTYNTSVAGFSGRLGLLAWPKRGLVNGLYYVLLADDTDCERQFERIVAHFKAQYPSLQPTERRAFTWWRPVCDVANGERVVRSATFTDSNGAVLQVRLSDRDVVLVNVSAPGL